MVLYATPGDMLQSFLDSYPRLQSSPDVHVVSVHVVSPRPRKYHPLPTLCLKCLTDEFSMSV